MRLLQILQSTLEVEKKLHNFPKSKKKKKNCNHFIRLMVKNTLVVNITEPPVFLCKRAYDSTVAVFFFEKG